MANVADILTDDTESTGAKMIREAVFILAFTVPSINTLLNETFPKYLYEKNFQKNKINPILVMHNS
jgi:hypothetical protein